MDKVKQIMLIATGIVFVLIITASIILPISVNAIKLPTSPTLTDTKITTEQEAKAKEISNYQNLTSQSLKLKTDIYDLIVIKALLPLFTTLITGIFTYIIAKFGIEFYKAYLVDKEKNRHLK